MARSTAALEAALRTAARLGPERTLVSRVRGRIDSFFGAGNLSFERNFLVVRPAIAALVALSVTVQGHHLPGREGVLVGCAAALVVDAILAMLMVKRRLHLSRAFSLVADNAIVIGASLYVFMKMGQTGYETDLWLLYLSLIVSNSLYYGPIGSLLFTTLWTSLFVFESKFFYASDTYFAKELPMRLMFFILTGFVSLSLSTELRKRRENLEQKTRQTLTMLATIVEARDTDAGMHLRHIQHYSHALALRLGLDDKAAREVAYAAMIHDVGKAQVPDAILKKPGPLTAEERREIEKHTGWGDELLSESEEFTAAREVARHHHERWDGSGYPDGLAGEGIPLAARIVAVADVYDALISERPYKRAWPPEEAIAEIRKMSGGHFDPAIVKAFVQLFDTNVLRDLDLTMRHDHGEDEQLSLAA
jgi:hypothetical protein